MSKTKYKKVKTPHPTSRVQPQTNKNHHKSPPKKQGPSFLKYLVDQKENRNYLIIAIVVNIVLLVLYKSYYPLPDFFSDAQGYIIAAARDNKVFYRPFGYSRFLQILHQVTSSHYLTVFIQYFFNLLASLFCFFSVDYLFKFHNKKIKFISWLFLSFNPFFLVLSNQIVSDIIFSGLTITWFTLLLWIFKKPQWWSLVLQLFVLYWVFHIRYNAIYFPFLLTILLLLAPRLRVSYRISGIVASALLIFIAYTNIKRQNLDSTGADVFAGFSGWQMANNALFIYKHVEVPTTEFEDPQLQLLDQFVKRYIDSIPQEELQQIAKGKLTSSVYIWDVNSPLKKFGFHYAAQNGVSYLVAWYRLSELYNQYGMQIIKNNPAAYWKYFLSNNLAYYIAPPREFMERYDLVNTELSDITKEWFDIKESKLHASGPNLQRIIIAPYPVLHAILVIFSIVMPLIYLIRKRKTEKGFTYSSIFPVVFWYLFWGANFVFSVLAAIIVLRYEAAFFVIAWTLPMYFLDATIRSFSKKQTDENIAEVTMSS